MNLGPGGKQPVMREGFIHSKQCPQPMVFPEDYSDPALRGKPKGIKQVLLERGLWRNGMRLDYKPKCQIQAAVHDNTCEISGTFKSKGGICKKSWASGGLLS